MKKYLIAFLICLLISSSSYARSSHTRGYVKKNGTYVAPAYKSSPNKSKYDNYTTKGNINPYTGKKGNK